MSQSPFSEDMQTNIENGDLISGLKTFLATVDVVVGKLRFFGGYADVFEGTDAGAKGGKVAIKRMRVHLDTVDREFSKTFTREIRIWSTLRHKNIVPLLGMTLVDGIPSLVSEWMDNGTVVSYLKTRPEANRRDLAYGIALGLEHIHKCGVVHSDIKGDNILVCCNGMPMISDFGISRILINSITVAGTSNLKGNTRWLSVELIDPRMRPDSSSHQFHTKQTDVWAFGMVVYELLTRKVPFHNLINDAMVMLEIIAGNLPSKPESDDYCVEDFDLLWGICNTCWSRDTTKRPSMSAIVRELEIAAGSYRSIENPGSSHWTPSEEGRGEFCDSSSCKSQDNPARSSSRNDSYTPIEAPSTPATSPSLSPSHTQNRDDGSEFELSITSARDLLPSSSIQVLGPSSVSESGEPESTTSNTSTKPDDDTHKSTPPCSHCGCRGVHAQCCHCGWRNGHSPTCPFL